MLVGFINTKGQEIFPPQFTGVYDVEIIGNRVTADDLFYLKSVSKNDGTSGVIDVATGKWVIRFPQYKRVFFYDRHHFTVAAQDFYAGDKKLSLPHQLKIKWIDFSPDFIEVENKMGAVGLYTWTGKEVISPDYLDFEIDSAARRIVGSKLKGGTSLSNLRRLAQAGKENGKEIVVDLYDFSGHKIAHFKSQYQAMLEGDSTGSFQVGEKTTYFSLTDGKILTGREKVIDTLPGGYELFQKNEQTGLRTTAGEIIIPPGYRRIHFIDSIHIVAQTPDVHYIVYNLQGKKMFDDVYSQLEYLPKLKRFMVSKDDKAGQIDMQGKVVIPLEYSGFSSLSLTQSPPYAVYKDGKNGIIDANGKTIVPFIYDNITDTRILDSTRRPYFIVEKEEHYGMMNAKGEWIIPPDYGYVSISKAHFYDQWIRLEAWPRSKNLEGAYNLKTKTFITPKYTTISIFKDFIIVANRNDNDYFHQLLNLRGEPLTDEDYTKMEFENGYLLCVKNRKYGVLNTKGKVLIPFAYQKLFPESSTLFMAEQNGDCFYMDIDGNEYRNPLHNKK